MPDTPSDNALVDNALVDTPPLGDVLLDAVETGMERTNTAMSRTEPTGSAPPHARAEQSDAQVDESLSLARPRLDPAELFAGTDTAELGTHVEGDLAPRFEGDTSALPAEVCWALQELVAAPHVTDKARKHWAVVLQYEEVLRSRLSELGLVLEVNREHRYAFTRQADDPSPHSRTILRARTLSLAASALALYLYQQYLVAPDEPLVSSTDMVDHMLAYKRPEDTDEAAFEKKIRTAIKALDDASIIKEIRGTNRFVISPVITSILTADRVAALAERYQTVAGLSMTDITTGTAESTTEDNVEENDE